MSAWESVLSEATRSLRGGSEELAGTWEDLRGEALSRGEQLLDEAKRHGTALLALAAQRGMKLARDYGMPLVAPRRRRRSGWKWVVAAVAVTVLVVGVASRD